MANTFKMKTKTGVTTQATVFTVPAATTGIVIGCMLANVHASSSAKVDVEITTASTTGENADNPKIVYQVPIPSGSSLEVLTGGKVVLETGDIFKVTSDVTIDVALSVLEIT
jgi:hypothetical protein